MFCALCLICNTKTRKRCKIYMLFYIKARCVIIMLWNVHIIRPETFVWWHGQAGLQVYTKDKKYYQQWGFYHHHILSDGNQGLALPTQRGSSVPPEQTRGYLGTPPFGRLSIKITMIKIESPKSILEVPIFNDYNAKI